MITKIIGKYSGGKSAALYAVMLAAFSRLCQGQGPSPTPLEGVSEAIFAAQQIQTPSLSVGATQEKSSLALEDQLKNELSAKGVNLSWDPEKERYVFITTSSIAIKERHATAENIIPRLYQANLALGVKAMQEFSGWLGKSSELDVNLSLGGSPVGKLYSEVQDRFQAELRDLMTELDAQNQELKKQRQLIDSAASADDRAKQELDREIAKMSQALEVLEKEAQKGPMLLTRVDKALDALSKKLDPAFDPAVDRAGAKDRAAETKTKLEAMKADRDNAVSEAGKSAREKVESLQQKIKNISAQAAAKKKEAEETLANYQQEYLSSSFKWAAEYPIVGLVPLKYYTSITPGEAGSYNIKVAAAYAWSPSMEREIKNLLTSDGPQSKVQSHASAFSTYNKELKKGDTTVNEWVKTLDPFTFGPSRWFIDKNGKFHVASCGLRLVGNGAAESASRRNVAIDAEPLLRLSLDVQFSDTGSREIRSITNTADSISEEKLAESVSKVKSKSTLSLGQLDIGSSLTMKLQDGSESARIRYVVLSINADSMRKAYAATMQMAESKYRTTLANAYREGTRQAARDHAKSAEAQVPAARAEGYSKARSDLASAPTPGGVAKSPSPSMVEVPSATAKKQSSAPVQTGIRKDNTPIPDFD